MGRRLIQHQHGRAREQRPGQEDALAPGGGAATIGGHRIEGRHEAVAVADMGRLPVQIEGIAGGS